ncbi:MAG: Holliday junction resolvase RuvX [Dehalococcoidia bacterium]
MDSPQQQPRRLLGIDPGQRRTGVAVSDDLGLYAHPRAAILTRGDAPLVEELARLVSADGISEVVVGLPLSLSGEDSAQTAQVRALVHRLRERLTIPVSTWDERLTSVQAGRSVREGRTRTGLTDSAAAALILQAVLDSRRGTAS